MSINNCYSEDGCLRAIKHNLDEITATKIQIISGKYPQFDKQSKRYIKESKKSIKAWKRRLAWIRENREEVDEAFGNKKKEIKTINKTLSSNTA